MAKKLILGSLAVFIAWVVLDTTMHGLILGSTYKAEKYASIWRAEMKMWLIYLVVLVSAVTFTYIYVQFFATKGMNTGIKYGIIFGIGAGISMGYGSYATMNIPYYMALTWFLGTLVEATVGGLLLGIIVKD